MLKNLKKKFILINMVMVGLVIAVVFGVVCVATYTQNRTVLERRLNTVIDLTFEENNMPQIGGNSGAIPKPGPSSVTSTIVITLDANNEILYSTAYFATISDAALQKALNIALTSNSDIGTISSMNIMFLRKTASQGSNVTRVAFTDTTAFKSTMRNTVLGGLAICGAVLTVMFAVSLWLSSLAIRPVKEAWTQQKQFIADASHELKTPLTVILANNNILRSHPESSFSEQSQWLESTEEEASRMKTLIDEMLFLAKSDSEQKEVTLSRINVSEIAERVALSFEPVAFEKNVTINSLIAPDIILGSDAALFDRLLHILLDNAVKHAFEDSAVTLALQKNGNHTYLSVNNRGDIISPEDLPHIFDRFYRADKARTADNSPSGYGLGLAIAKNILKSLKGDIVVSSNLENGTTFTVAF